MTARPKTFHLEYDRHGRQWIAWQGTTGHIIGPVGRKAATAKAMEMVLEYRRDYIPYIRKRRAALRAIREARAWEVWHQLPSEVNGLRKRLHRKNLAIAQGAELLRNGMMPGAIHSIHYTVPADALQMARSDHAIAR